MKKIVSVIVLFVVSTPVLAEWAMIRLDELVADTDLIVVGTLHSAVENSEYEGKGYILVDRLITRTVPIMQGRPLIPGDNLKIKWLDNWACTTGMHLGRVNKEGVWLLKIEKDGTVSAAYPGRFRANSDLVEVENLLHREKIQRKASRVDVLIPQIEAPKSAVVVERLGPDLAVDISAYGDFSLYRGLIVAFVAFGLYIILYRSRFRIR